MWANNINFYELIDEHHFASYDSIFTDTITYVQERQNLSHANDQLELRRALQKRNHPSKGSTNRVDPIRNRKSIEEIKDLLAGEPRNLCLFTLGINTAYRACELLSLRVGDVAHLGVGDIVDLKQGKNKKYRNATLNVTTQKAVQAWLEVHPTPHPNAPLFLSQKGGALQTSFVNRLVKKWCKKIGLQGNYGSHSMRKTWGYHQRMEHMGGESIMPLLMRAFGHATEAQTLDYLCIQPDELKHLYLKVEL